MISLYRSFVRYDMECQCQGRTRAGEGRPDSPAGEPDGVVLPRRDDQIPLPSLRHGQLHPRDGFAGDRHRHAQRAVRRRSRRAFLSFHTSTWKAWPRHARVCTRVCNDTDTGIGIGDTGISLPTPIPIRGIGDITIL